jgi:hypothetical protein
MPPLPATGLLTWGPSRLRAVIRLLLAEHCLPVDSDLTGFPASHAIWDDHGPKAARSEPLFDLLPKGPTRTRRTPGDFSVIPVQTPTPPSVQVLGSSLRCTVCQSPEPDAGNLIQLRRPFCRTSLDHPSPTRDRITSDRGSAGQRFTLARTPATMRHRPWRPGVAVVSRPRS